MLMLNHKTKREFDDVFPKGQPFVLLHPTARYTFKAWPLERFAASGGLVGGEGPTCRVDW